MLNHSITESRIFNYNFYRYTDKQLPELNTFVSEIIKNEADIVILRIPSSCQNHLFILNNLGFNWKNNLRLAINAIN